MASELGGTSGGDAVDRANQAGQDAVELTNQDVNLGNYDEVATSGAAASD